MWRTWWSTRSPRERRTCVIAGAVSGIALLFGQIAPGMIAWTREQHASTELSTLQLAGMRAMVRNDAAQRTAIASAQRWAAAFDSTVGVPVPRAVAEARLIAMLTDVADDANAAVSSLQIVATPVGARRAGTSARRAADRVVVRLTGQADTDELTALLGGIESARSVLSLRSLSISASGRSPRDGVSPRPLQFDMQVATLVLSESSAPILPRRQ